MLDDRRERRRGSPQMRLLGSQREELREPLLNPATPRTQERKETREVPVEPAGCLRHVAAKTAETAKTALRGTVIPALLSAPPALRPAPPTAS